MKDNPCAGFGTLMLPALVNRMIDAFITTDGIAALVRGQKPADVKGRIAPERHQPDDPPPRMKFPAAFAPGPLAYAVPDHFYKIGRINWPDQIAGLI